MTPEIEWTVFILLSLSSIVMAALMIITMSMYRAGLALMASLLSLAGLFVLLDADLMAAMQVMMNVGGMVVMILFMVMIMMDPGGEMMWNMKRDMRMRGLGALSMRMPKPAKAERAHSASESPPDETNARAYTCPMHPEVRQDQPGECPKCGMQLVPSTDQPHAGHQMAGMDQEQHRQMMSEMAMSTAQLPWALALGAAAAILLSILVIRTHWRLSSQVPSADASEMVGKLLLSRYMIAFEGAGLLILAGMVGVVVFAVKLPSGKGGKR